MRNSLVAAQMARVHVCLNPTGDPVVGLSALPKEVFVVRVRDTFCGVKGQYSEECVTTNEVEARNWQAQWKGEYDRADGYAVTFASFPNGLPTNFKYSI